LMPSMTLVFCDEKLTSYEWHRTREIRIWR
jgi:hypothetical protein